MLEMLKEDTGSRFYLKESLIKLLNIDRADLPEHFVEKDDTVYNYVHPNNHRMIEFLRKRGYTVLNLIEIRRPYKDEKLTQTIAVGEHEFDY